MPLTVILPIVIDRFRNPRQSKEVLHAIAGLHGSDQGFKHLRSTPAPSFEWVSCAIRRWPSLYLAMALHLLDNLHIKLGASRYFITITDTKTDKRHDTLLLQSQFLPFIVCAIPCPPFNRSRIQFLFSLPVALETRQNIKVSTQQATLVQR